MIPAEWTNEPLGELIDYDSGRTPSRANPIYWEGDATVPWVAISDMENYGTISKTREMITQQAFDDVFRRRIVRAGTLLMSFKLTIGRVSTLGIDACHNEAIISIRPRARVDQRYLGYFLSQVDYDDLQDRQIKGNTLNQDKIDRIPVVLPPKQEQSEIADVLDHTRQAIALESRTVVAASSLKRAAMREFFAKGLRGEGEKETDIGLMPQSWKAARLSDLFEIKHGFAFDGDYFRSSGEYILLTPGHFFEEGGFRDQREKTKFFTGSIPDEYILEAGNLLIAMTEQKAGLLGSSAIIPSVGSYLHNQRLGLIVNLQPVLNRKYLYHILNSEPIRSEIARTATGSKVKHTSPGRIGDLFIGLPPLDEQHEVVEILDAIDRKIGVHKHKRAVLESLFKTLLYQLMAGEIRVADLDLSVLGKAPLEGVAA